MTTHFFRILLSWINKIFPKWNHVVVQGFPNIEASAIEVANRIVADYGMRVYFVISKRAIDNPVGLLNDKITIISNSGIRSIVLYLTAKIIFFTHGSPLSSFSRRQTVVNIWHGALYKKVGKLIGHAGIPAHYTVATSQQTKKMFADAFGVPLETICVSGYPRNDVLINSKKEKRKVINEIDLKWESYSKIIVWLPTFRKSVYGDIRIDGEEVGNPFYIKNFDLKKFNDLLIDNNILCVLKPHPMAPKYDEGSTPSNVVFIDDVWLANRNLTLYHLVGISDALISDVSSIMIDYLLMDKPIVCVSADFEEYRNSRGFYFDDIEKWIPCDILSYQEQLFQHLESLFSLGVDSNVLKRKELKEFFFDDYDAMSTHRLLNFVFKGKMIL